MQDSVVCSPKDRLFKKTHGLSKHPIYKIWKGIVFRCTSPKFIGYKNYGGRGIKVCDKWAADFKSFYRWAIKNGWAEGLEIDRYPNNNGDYEPSNCRWVTRKINSRNRRTNHILTIGNKSLTLVEWAEISGINADVISHRIYMGWISEDAVFTPIRSRNIRQGRDILRLSTNVIYKGIREASIELNMSISNIESHLYNKKRKNRDFVFLHKT